MNTTENKPRLCEQDDLIAQLVERGIFKHSGKQLYELTIRELIELHREQAAARARIV